MRPSTSLAYNVCSARATTPPRGGSGSHSLRCFDNGQRLAAFAVDHLRYWHCAQSCCSLWGSPLQGHAASALKTMELCSEPADYTGVSAKHSPTSLWLYAPGVHYRPKINRKNPNAAARGIILVHNYRGKHSIISAGSKGQSFKPFNMKPQGR